MTGGRDGGRATPAPPNHIPHLVFCRETHYLS